MICDRCGRILNRATGKCVCEAYGGDPPLPVATTHLPAEAPRPLSAAAAFAVLDATDRPTKPSRPVPPVAALPPAPMPPPRAAGTPLATISKVRVGRRRVDAVAYDKALVLAARARGKKAAAARAGLSAGRLAGLDPANRVIDTNVVHEVLVREDKVSGRASIHLTSGERVILSWWGVHNRGVEAEHLLADVFPGRVDQDDPAVIQRIFKASAALAFGIALVLALFGGTSVLLKPDPPPPAPPPPPVTVPTAEQAVRSGLAPACAAWTAFVAHVTPGDRPSPAALRPIVDGLRGPFDAAASASADYVAARDEVVYLQGYSRRPPDAVARESVSRVGYAVRLVGVACDRAASTA